MRRLLLLGCVALLAAVLAPVASASVTIGATDIPSLTSVRYLPGDKVVIFFAPANEAATLSKTWTAPINNLAAGTYKTGGAAQSEITSAQKCQMYSTADDTSAASGASPIASTLSSGRHAMVTRTCTLPTGWTVYVQTWVQQAPDFGSESKKQTQNVNVSVVNNFNLASNVKAPNPVGLPVMQFGEYTLPSIGAVTFNGWPVLQASPRWSKFSPGGYKGYLAGKHFAYLFGSFTYGGAGVWGPGNKNGSPTNAFGRNVYIDTFNSDFGSGWRRIVGVLTQKPNGTYCYELSPKGGSNGKTGVGQFYSLTVQGPGNAPDQRVIVNNPDFSFGNEAYNAKTDKWGTNFSDAQALALRDQAAQMGPDFRRKVKGTDCAQQLRQLPPGFIPPTS